MIGALVAGITGAGGASLSSYESIATATGTGSSGTITFSSIPSTFKHLEIRGLGKSSSAGSTYINVNIRFNGDTGANYAYHYLQADGTSVYASGTASSTSAEYVGQATLNSANAPAGNLISILDYASTTKNKTLRSFVGNDNNGTGRPHLGSGLWISTAAISSISLIIGSGNFTTDTTFALYGIKEA